MDKLTTTQIGGYLPFKLKCLVNVNTGATDWDICTFSGLSIFDEIKEVAEFDGIPYTFPLDRIKPRLYPLSEYHHFEDILEEMTNNEISMLEDNPDLVLRLPYSVIQLMYKNHIDIHGLIHKKLAYNIKNDTLPDAPFQLAKAVLVRTRDRSVLSRAYLANPSYLRYNPAGYKDDSFQSNDNQTLCIITEDALKPGDWIYNELSGIGRYLKNEEFNTGIVVIYHQQGYEVAEDLKNVKKIIASTDYKLVIQEKSIWATKPLPRISERFLEDFTTTLNDNKNHTDVAYRINELYNTITLKLQLYEK